MSSVPPVSRTFYTNAIAELRPDNDKSNAMARKTRLQPLYSKMDDLIHKREWLKLQSCGVCKVGDEKCSACDKSTKGAQLLRELGQTQSEIESDAVGFYDSWRKHCDALQRCPACQYPVANRNDEWCNNDRCKAKLA